MYQTTNTPENSVVSAIINEVLERERDNEKRRMMIEEKMQAENVSPEQFMNALIPSLFLGVSCRVTNEQALEVLVLLATSDPSRYLKPASRIMKNFILASDLATLTLSDDLLTLMVTQISTNPDVELSDNLMESVVAFCDKERDTSSRLPTLLTRSLTAISQAFQKAWDEKLQHENSQQSSTSCVRCCAAIVMLCGLMTRREDDLLSKKRALDDCLLVILLDNNDPLLQMSALDLIDQLTVARVTQREWLLSKKTLEPLFQMAGNEEDESHPILGGSTIRILSSICKVVAKHDEDANFDQSESSSLLLTRFHHVLRNFTSGKSELDRLAQLDAISSFGVVSSQALEVILDDELIVPCWLSLSVAQPKLISAILYSVAMVLNYHYSNSSDAPVGVKSDLCMRLFVMLGQINNKGDNGSMPLVLSHAKSPVTETRLGAYELLQSVCRKSMFARAIFLNGSDLFEFLLNREGAETTVEGKEAKFKIVEAIFAQEKLTSLMDSKLVKALETHIKQGPHYRHTQSWDVATEQ